MVVQGGARAALDFPQPPDLSTPRPPRAALNLWFLPMAPASAMHWELSTMLQSDGQVGLTIQLAGGFLPMSTDGGASEGLDPGVRNIPNGLPSFHTSLCLQWARCIRMSREERWHQWLWGHRLLSWERKAGEALLWGGQSLSPSHSEKSCFTPEHSPGLSRAPSEQGVRVRAPFPGAGGVHTVLERGWKMEIRAPGGRGTAGSPCSWRILGAQG